MPTSQFTWCGAFNNASPEIDTLKNNIARRYLSQSNPDNFPGIFGVDMDKENLAKVDLGSVQTPVVVVAWGKDSKPKVIKKIRKELARHPQQDKIVSIVYCTRDGNFSTYDIDFVEDYIQDAHKGYWKALDALDNCPILLENDKQKILAALQRQKASTFSVYLKSDTVAGHSAEVIQALLKKKIWQALHKKLVASNANKDYLTEVFSWQDSADSRFSSACSTLKSYCADTSYERSRARNFVVAQVFLTLTFLVVFGLLTLTTVPFLFPFLTVLTLSFIAFLPVILGKDKFDNLIRTDARKTTKVFIELCKEEAKRNIEEDFELDDLLAMAVKLDDRRLVSSLLSAGAKGTSELLSFAIRKGYQNIVEVLLKADVPFASLEDIAAIYEKMPVDESLERLINKSFNPRFPFCFVEENPACTMGMEGIFFYDDDKNLLYVDEAGNRVNVNIEDVARFETGLEKIKKRSDTKNLSLQDVENLIRFNPSVIMHHRTLCTPAELKAMLAKISPNLPGYDQTLVESGLKVTKNQFEENRNLFITIHDIEKILTPNGGFTLANQSALLEKNRFLVTSTIEDLNRLITKMKVLRPGSLLVRNLTSIRNIRIRLDVADKSRFLLAGSKKENACTVLFAANVPPKAKPKQAAKAEPGHPEIIPSRRFDFIFTKPDKDSKIRLYAVDNNEDTQEVPIAIENYDAIEAFVDQARDGYTLELMSTEELQKNKLYIAIENGLLRYKLIGFDGELKQDSIALSEIDLGEIPNPVTSTWLNERAKDLILAVTTKRGHTLKTHPFKIDINAEQVEKVITKNTGHCWQPSFFSNLPDDVIPSIASLAHTHQGLPYQEGVAYAQKALF